MQWLAQAPANIALIKYMGKDKPESNLPSNPSLSYTLNALQSTVQLEINDKNQDIWQPLTTETIPGLQLSQAAQHRFLNHLARLKSLFNYTGGFIVRSANNFPQSSGLASSASSFAALTKCASIALSELKKMPTPNTLTMAQWSRLGSGSSCRSFFEPWALWDGEAVSSIHLPYTQLIHQAVIISDREKEIASSLAHQRVQSSPHFKDRSQRASNNLKALLSAFHDHDWRLAYELCWQEFNDMHQLFSSCDTPFSYINQDSQKLLHELQIFWEQKNDGPIITMDAGPNIHLLWRSDQRELINEFEKNNLTGRFNVL